MQSRSLELFTSSAKVGSGAVSDMNTRRHGVKQLSAENDQLISIKVLHTDRMSSTKSYFESANGRVPCNLIPKYDI